MATLSVWAPAAERVDALVDVERVAMRAGNDGWWHAEIPGARPGTRYSFAVDGREPRPDPRSASQPDGVDGPSCLVDHAEFDWHDAGWRPVPFASAVIYELHAGTFTPEGTFDEAVARLDDLVDLGVTHVEVMPVAAFPGARGWGYDGVDLYAPHHDYGGPDALKRFVDACHARGLAAIVDVVYNHLGPAGNYLREFGPYFSDRYGTPWGEAVNLDLAGSDEVRRFFCDNALMWLRDYRFDGLRIDAVHAIFDSSAVHFLEQLNDDVRRLEAETGREFVVIAESDLNDPRLIRPTGVGGYGLDAQWNEDFHHALHAVLTGERGGYYADFGRLADLAKALEQGFVYDGRYSVYRDRRHGRPAPELAGDRFVVCMQNHDQIGNRAHGERIGHLVPTERLKVGAAIMLTSPFVPMLFQGEEWAASAPFQYFTSHVDPALGAAIREGRREEFRRFDWAPDDIPDPQDPATFARSKLDWSERVREPHAGILDWYRQLIRLRARLPSPRDDGAPHARVRFDEAAQWLAFERGPFTIACNLAGRAQPVALGAAGTLALGSTPEIRMLDGRVELPPDSVAIVSAEAATADSGRRRPRDP